MEERIFSPRFKSAGFVNVDADLNDDEDVTVKTNAKSHAELPKSVAGSVLWSDHDHEHAQ